MSYSRKKHPFVSRSTADTERDDKRIAHRRERHAVRQRLRVAPEADVLPHRKDFGDHRDFGKDGKWYLPARAARHPSLSAWLGPRLRK